MLFTAQGHVFVYNFTPLDGMTEKVVLLDMNNRAGGPKWSIYSSSFSGHAASGAKGHMMQMLLKDWKTSAFQSIPRDSNCMFVAGLPADPPH